VGKGDSFWSTEVGIEDEERERERERERGDGDGSKPWFGVGSLSGVVSLSGGRIGMGSLSKGVKV
jgi:hypothetical protein